MLLVESIAEENAAHGVAVAADALAVVLARTVGPRTVSNTVDRMVGMGECQSAEAAFAATAAESPSDMVWAAPPANSQGADVAGSTWTEAFVSTATCSCNSSNGQFCEITYARHTAYVRNKEADPLGFTCRSPSANLRLGAQDFWHAQTRHSLMIRTSWTVLQEV